jgi:hypothetical protein
MVLRLLLSLGISLGLTLALELLYALATGKRGKDLVLVCLVNVITNPVVVLVYFLASAYTPLHPVFLKAALEIMAVVIEALYYRRYGVGYRHPLLFSMGANAFSFFSGELILLIGG